MRLWHPGDANGYVEARRSHADMVTMNLDPIHFDAPTGEILHRFEAAPVMAVPRFSTGVHFIQFEHWRLRWLYFFAGLAGCGRTRSSPPGPPQTSVFHTFLHFPVDVGRRVFVLHVHMHAANCA